MITGCYSFWKHNTQLFLGRRDLLILFRLFFPVSSTNNFYVSSALDAILPVDRNSMANRTGSFIEKKQKFKSFIRSFQSSIQSYLACSFIGIRGFFGSSRIVLIRAAFFDTDRFWHERADHLWHSISWSGAKGTGMGMRNDFGISMTNRFCLFVNGTPAVGRISSRVSLDYHRRFGLLTTN
jgi:hypothetical protein